MLLPVFDPWSPLLGGALIGISATVLMWAIGRIAGVSGLITRAVVGGPESIDRLGAVVFILGVLVAPWALCAITGRVPEPPETAGVVTMAIGGGLIGVGAALANGCTSGHGVCGLARFSRRSAAAVGTFMAVAVATVALRRLTGAFA